ncbi:MAG: hypothetical protein CMJ40_09270 [Phycisphaerae bacterium]|nr:hypothetical protein [Phycisphaerae bacterium]|tara:strand:+ start:2465 stop:3007 length:543 start_codon:yes stop_codon:yes gene_type:complete
MNHSTKNEHSERQLLEAALQEAMSRDTGSDWDDIDAESLALLAQGRSGELNPADRAQLLKRVAGDPGLGALLKSLREDMDDVIGIPTIRRTRFVLRLACTACIVAMVFVGTSVLTDDRLDGKSVGVLDAGSGKNEFLDQLGSTTPSALTRLAGDPVFVGLFVLAVVLGCGSFWPRKSSRT